jgi:hypothetical protein
MAACAENHAATLSATLQEARAYPLLRHEPKDDKTIYR